MWCILKDYKSYNHSHGRIDCFSTNLLVDTDLSIAVHLDQNQTWCGCMAAHSSGPLEPIDIRLFQPAEVISVGTNCSYSIVRVICWFRMTNHQTVIYTRDVYMQLFGKNMCICRLDFICFWSQYGLNHAGKCRKWKEIAFRDEKYSLAAPEAR